MTDIFELKINYCVGEMQFYKFSVTAYDGDMAIETGYGETIDFASHDLEIKLFRIKKNKTSGHEASK